MSESPQEHVTKLLNAIEGGEEGAWTRLVPLIHGELRKIARARVARLRPGDSVTATELVQDTYLRLLGRGTQQWHNRKHFYAAVSRSMRDLLVDEARRRHRQKRGGEWSRVELASDIAHQSDDAETMLAIDEALQRLERQDELQHRIVELRYFTGLSIDEVADVLAVSPSTVDRQWKFARAWLHRELTRGGATDG